MRQWQCPCGEWLSMDQAKHIHAVNSRQPTMDEMIAARLSGREKDALALVTDITETPWQPEYPRRDKPDEQS